MLDLTLDRIRRFRRQEGLSPRAFALMAELSAGAVKNIERPDWSPSASTIRALEKLIPENFDTPPDAAA